MRYCSGCSEAPLNKDLRHFVIFKPGIFFVISAYLCSLGREKNKKKKKRERDPPHLMTTVTKVALSELNLALTLYYVIVFFLVTKSALDSQEVTLKCTAQK